jgi:hypothetical protein
VAGSVRAFAERLRRRAHGDAIPLADAALLDAAARRTRLVRLGLAAALAAAAITAVVLAPDAPGRRFLPANAVGIIVLDVSSSVRPDTYYRIEHELATLAATRRRLGLVLFSDVAYEALPPGTPASELKPLLRFFAPPTTPRTHSDEVAQGLPRSPWEQWFSAGTNISSGLFLAYDMLRHDHVERGAVVLISDLEDDPGDLGSVADAVLLYEQNGIPLEIVGLNPPPKAAEYFKQLLGTEAIFQQAKLPTEAEARGKIALTGTFATGLAVAGAIAILLLALNEWWAEPLRWRPRRPA